MKTVLVHLTGAADDEKVLGTASAIGGAFVPHLQVLFIAPNPVAMIAPIVAVDMAAYSMTAEAITAFEQDTAARRQRAVKTFEHFCKHHDIRRTDAPPATHMSAEWKEKSGDVTDVLIREARFCDIAVVAGSPKSDLRHLPVEALGQLIISSGRPVVLSSPHGLKAAPATIAIAWKNTPEAARALAAAMPLLEKAKKVIVVGASESQSAAADATQDAVIKQLRWHGISATGHNVAVEGNGAAEAIIHDVNALRADLLVMGGYGHSRTRELIFGGFTAHVLRGLDIPVFIAH